MNNQAPNGTRTTPNNNGPSPANGIRTPVPMKQGPATGTPPSTNQGITPRTPMTPSKGRMTTPGSSDTPMTAPRSNGTAPTRSNQTTKPNDSVTMPKAIPNGNMNMPGTIPNVEMNTPGSMPNNGMIMPGSMPNNGMNMPGNMPDNGMNMPRTMPDNGMNMPGTMPNNGMSMPWGVPDDGMNIPWGMPNNRMNVPGSMPFITCPYYPGTQMGIPNATSSGAPVGVPLLPLYGYDNSDDLDKDLEYMRQLYPSTARAIQKEIIDECDKLEYDGSLMYDEYPDKVSLDRMIDRIYDKIRYLDEEPQLEANSIYYYPRRRSNFLRDLVSIVLLNEVFNRRRRYRSRRRWF